MIGHNGYSFDDVVAENLERGLLLAQRDCAARALQDPRLSQRHRVVLAQLILMTNQSTGTAFPGRRYLSEVTGYSESGVAKTISELVDWDYVVSARKAPEPGRRPLAHYSVIKPSIEDLQRAVTQHIEALRRGSDVTPVGNVTSPSKVTPWGNVTPNSNVTPVGNVEHATQKNIEQNQQSKADVTPVGNVTPVDPTVTSIDSSTSNSRASGERGAGREGIASPNPTKGSRLPSSWTIPPEWGRWTTTEFVVQPSHVRREAERFRDYWIAQPSPRGVKLNWEATWRNWARKAFEGKERGSHAASVTPEAKSSFDRLAAVYAKIREEADYEVHGSGE